MVCRYYPSPQTKWQSRNLCSPNKSVKREVHPMPTVDESLAKLGNSKIFSQLDVNSGFWQIPLDLEFRLLTTFVTPYNVLSTSPVLPKSTYYHLGRSFRYRTRRSAHSGPRKWGTQPDLLRIQGPVSRKPRKLFGPVKRFLVHLYLKTESCIRLKFS